jgi:hypothetical protein
MQPEITTPSPADIVSLPRSKIDVWFPELNHRFIAYLLVSIGLAGCVLEVSGPIYAPRLVLFASFFVLGTLYALRLVMRWRRVRRARRAAAIENGRA